MGQGGVGSVAIGPETTVRDFKSKRAFTFLMVLISLSETGAVSYLERAGALTVSGSQPAR